KHEEDEILDKAIQPLFHRVGICLYSDAANRLVKAIYIYIYMYVCMYVYLFFLGLEMMALFKKEKKTS
ncbi:MAG: hypothetical protein NW900_01870, partial [Candidatus Blochmannia sp. A2]|nr:hypothetical protein [Candidatus Blochmannia sp. A2]